MTQRLITCKEVTYLTGLPRASVYAEMKRGFPLPVPRGGSRAVAWVETEVQKWIDGQIAKRDKHAA